MGDRIKLKKQTSVEEKLKTPSLYKVLLKNDDYTTMEFVITVLQAVFHKSVAEAEKIMLTIHFQGVGHCGTYPHAIAETKADQTRIMARKQGYPLRAIVEEA